MRFTKVGLTGGIATGKSSVADLWRAHGAATVDSDVLAHRTLEPGTPTYAAVVQQFGQGILNVDGTINRPALGAIVFSDASRRQELNAIVHPAVRQMWAAELVDIERGGQTPVAVVAVPLLFEVGAEQEFDCTVAVGCSEPSQLARLRAIGLDEIQARARIQSQMPVQQKMDRADYAIWNDGSRAVLARQAEMIWDKINPARNGIKES